MQQIRRDAYQSHSYYYFPKQLGTPLHSLEAINEGESLIKALLRFNMLAKHGRSTQVEGLSLVIAITVALHRMNKSLQTNKTSVIHSLSHNLEGAC